MRLKDRIKNKIKFDFTAVKDVKIFTYCYIVCVIAVVLFVLLSFATDRVLRATGVLQSETLLWEDIVPWEIIPTDDGKKFSFSIDPQILLPEKDQLISTVELKMDFEGETGELAAYYTTESEPEFSVLNRVYGYRDEEGAVFDFGLKNVTSIRIDPASYVTVLGVFNSIEINPERNLADFFKISGSTIYFIVLIPAMIAAIICTFKHQWEKK